MNRKGKKEEPIMWEVDDGSGNDAVPDKNKPVGKKADKGAALLRKVGGHAEDDDGHDGCCKPAPKATTKSQKAFEKRVRAFSSDTFPDITCFPLPRACC